MNTPQTIVRQMPPPPPSLAHYDALDGLRGIAAFVVAFVYHYTLFATKTYPFSKILYWPYHFGWTLIDLFYVLSGFIFFKKYTSPIAERTISLKKYFLLRFSRLYPLHWLTLLVVSFFVFFRHINALSYFPFDGQYKCSLFLFLLNIPLMQYGWFYSAYKSFNGNTWTLSVEIMMYLMFFALVYWTCSPNYADCRISPYKKRGILRFLSGNRSETSVPERFHYLRSDRKVFLGCIVLVCAGVFLGVLKQAGFDFPILGVCQGMIGFFIGCITAGLYNYCVENKELCRVVTIVSVGFMVFALFLSVATIYSPFFSTLLSYSSMGYWIVVYSFLLFPSLIFLSLRFKFLTRVFSIKPLRYLGQISFSIYLIHFPVALIITTIDEYFQLKIDYSLKFVFFSYMAIVLFFSHISHFYFEAPVQRWIRKIFGLLQ
jgi:peptidoglycan/LPS O-acetylase OafA/YrhL